MQASVVLKEGKAVLGIELGSTNIKATLIGPDNEVLANGSHNWENQFENRLWTYSLEATWAGIQDAVNNVFEQAEAKHGVKCASVAALGVSAMMHGYLAFDRDDQLLTPFRTWRNTNTGTAAAALTQALDYNIPLRWSIAHFAQAAMDQESHLPQVTFLTTLAGYVHWQLTGEKVLGVGDASGMFPIDPATRQYDTERLAKADKFLADHGVTVPLEDLLPRPLKAGELGGKLTSAGAALLDPKGRIVEGTPLCPPEGDAGTGMVATNSVTPRTGNVSAGTSIFAMIVLERALKQVHEEIDLVTTPAGDLVAMVHCNNGASELADWAGLFTQFTDRLGHHADQGEIYQALLGAALEADADAGGVLAYNYLAGEPVTGLEEGRPMVVRKPGSTFSLANFMRAEVYAMFATLSLGMKVLHGEEVALDSMFAHGGIFKTEGVAQRFLAAAVEAPVSVSQTASEGGSWGIAILAQYMISGGGASLSQYLKDVVFADTKLSTVEPQGADVEGYSQFLAEFQSGLAIQRAAVQALR